MTRLLLILAAAFLLALSGCDRTDSSELQGAADESEAARPGAARAAEDHFEMKLTSDAEQLSVEVTATDGFKINTEYPWHLSLDDAPAGAPASLRANDAETLDESLARFVVDRAAFQGADEVTGKLRFSVCSEATCLMKTEDVRWPLQ